MASNKDEAEGLRALCAQIHADDGIDPREDKKHAAGRANNERKLRQLCKQVGQAVQMALAGVELLDHLTIVAVQPAPDAGRLRVTLGVADLSEKEQVAARLEQCRGYLRCEVAQMVARRRVPELVFAIIREGHENE